MFEIKKDDKLKNILNKIKKDNIAFTFTMEKEKFITCSCGYIGKIKDTASCPKCGCGTVVQDVDIKKDSVPLYYGCHIAKDNENIMAAEISLSGMVFNEEDGRGSYIINNDTSFVICYDKINSFMFLSDEALCFWSDDKITGYNLSYDLVDNMEALLSNGDTVNIIEPSDTSFYAGLNTDWEMGEDYLGICGAADIIKSFASAANIPAGMITGDSFYEQLSVLAVLCNIKWIYQLLNRPEYKNLKNSGIPFHRIPEYRELKNFGVSDLSSCIKECIQLKQAGMKMDADTIEDAFGTPVNILKKLKNTGAWAVYKDDIKKLEEAGLDIANTSYADEFTSHYIVEKILMLAGNANADIQTVDSHIKSGIRLGSGLLEILNTDLAILGSEDRGIFDISKPFSRKLTRQAELAENGLVKPDGFKKFASKPTLDTAYKIFVEHAI